MTVPRLRPIFLTTVMLFVIWTATNLTFVLVLTRGGPASRTEIFPHLAFQTALGARRLGMGAAVSLIFSQLLAVLIGARVAACCASRRELGGALGGPRRAGC